MPVRLDSATMALVLAYCTREGDGFVGPLTGGFRRRKQCPKNCNVVSLLFPSVPSVSLFLSSLSPGHQAAFIHTARCQNTAAITIFNPLDTYNPQLFKSSGIDVRLESVTLTSIRIFGQQLSGKTVARSPSDSSTTSRHFPFVILLSRRTPNHRMHKMSAVQHKPLQQYCFYIKQITAPQEHRAHPRGRTDAPFSCKGVGSSTLLLPVQNL